MTREGIEKAWGQAYSMREEDGGRGKELVDEKLVNGSLYRLWEYTDGGYGYDVEVFVGFERVPQEVAVFGKRVAAGRRGKGRRM